MDVLINYTSKMLSHYVSISNHHDLHLKYPTISCQLCRNLKQSMRNFISLMDYKWYFYFHLVYVNFCDYYKVKYFYVCSEVSSPPLSTSSTYYLSLLHYLFSSSSSSFFPSSLPSTLLFCFFDELCVFDKKKTKIEIFSFLDQR